MQAHRGVIFIFRYQSGQKYKNVAMGLLGTLKLIFVFLVTVQAYTWEILLEKRKKFTVKFLVKIYTEKKKKIKKKKLAIFLVASFLNSTGYIQFLINPFYEFYLNGLFANGFRYE